MPETTLPDELDALKVIICTLSEKNDGLIAEIDSLTTENRLLKDKLFGSKSEKSSRIDKEQARLFNEAEDGIEESKESDKTLKTTKIKEHERRKAGRKPLSKELPRKEIIHDIDEAEKVCACGHELTKISSVENEELEVIPEQVVVNRHIRLKYACKNCEGVEDEDSPSVKIAPSPAKLIPKSITTPSLLAYVITRKFVDGIPFYRMEKIFSRIGAEISRASMCHWAMKVHRRLNRFMKLMFLECRDGPLVGIDETTVPVLKEKDKAATSKSYMWVMRLVNENKKAVFFRYRKNRNAGFLKRLLKNYRGVVQTDAVSGYNFLDEKSDVVHAACWAHARRKFVELSKSKGKAEVANIGLSLISELYAIEKEAREAQLSATEIQKLRQDRSEPLVARLKYFLDKKANTTIPRSSLGKAVNYCL